MIFTFTLPEDCSSQLYANIDVDIDLTDLYYASEDDGNTVLSNDIPTNIKESLTELRYLKKYN